MGAERIKTKRTLTFLTNVTMTSFLFGDDFYRPTLFQRKPKKNPLRQKAAKFKPLFDERDRDARRQDSAKTLVVK